MKRRRHSSPAATVDAAGRQRYRRRNVLLRVPAPLPPALPPPISLAYARAALTASTLQDIEECDALSRQMRPRPGFAHAAQTYLRLFAAVRNMVQDCGGVLLYSSNTRHMELPQRLRAGMSRRVALCLYAQASLVLMTPQSREWLQQQLTAASGYDIAALLQRSAGSYVAYTPGGDAIHGTYADGGSGAADEAMRDYAAAVRTYQKQVAQDVARWLLASPPALQLREERVAAATSGMVRTHVRGRRRDLPLEIALARQLQTYPWVAPLLQPDMAVQDPCAITRLVEAYALVAVRLWQATQRAMSAPLRDADDAAARAEASDATLAAFVLGLLYRMAERPHGADGAVDPTMARPYTVVPKPWQLPHSRRLATLLPSISRLGELAQQSRGGTGSSSSATAYSAPFTRMRALFGAAMRVLCRTGDASVWAVFDELPSYAR